MKIFTSYYKKLESCGVKFMCIQVSNTKPAWFIWDTYELKSVYPKWDLVKGLKQGYITRDEYTHKYKQQLDTLDKNSIIRQLHQIYRENDYKPIVLLCYENKSGFCHRHILAEWLGMDIEELEF